MNAAAARASAVKPWIRRGLAAAAQTMSWAPRRLRGSVCVLAYHRILRVDQAATIRPQPGMYVTTNAFEDHLKFLSDHFRVLPLPALLDRWDEGSIDSREPQCVITFDDGWIDTYEQAFPLLQQYRLPATVFLPTAFVGTKDWFWPDVLLRIARKLDEIGRGDCRDALRVDLGLRPLGGAPIGDTTDDLVERCKKLPVAHRLRLLRRFSRFSGPRTERAQVVDWAAVEIMSRHRMTFGSHTHTHAILPQLSNPEASTELALSLRALSRPNIQAVPVLSYPNGTYDARIAALAKQSGYKAAVTMRFGFEREKPADMLGIRRVGIHQDIASSAALFAYHIAGGNQMLSWS